MEAVQEILRVLEDLLYIHEEMLSLEKQKQRVLIEDRSGELLSLLQDQSKLVKRITRLEEERKVSVHRFLEQKGLEHADLSLTDLMKLITSHQDKGKLEQVSEKLYARLEDLRQLNQLNQQLIEQSLSYLNFTMRFITEEPINFTTYQRGEEVPQVHSAQQRRFFDTKA